MSSCHGRRDNLSQIFYPAKFVEQITILRALRDMI